MKILLLSLFLCVIWTPLAFAQDGQQPPKFATLKDALTFVDHALDTQNWNGLSNALYPPLQPSEPNRTDWTQLQNARDKLRLADVFSDQNFPSTGDSYVIKVPRNVLMGGSRIRFTKVGDNSWCLNAIYIVR